MEGRRPVRNALVASLLFVAGICGGCGDSESPSPKREPVAADGRLTEAEVRALLPDAAAADPEAWTTIVALGAVITGEDVKAAPSLPALAMVVGSFQWPPEARRDVRFDPTFTPLDLEEAAKKGAPAAAPGAKPPVPTLLRPECIDRVTVSTEGDGAHGDVWFHATGYEGRVRYKAVRQDGRWSIVAFEFPFTKARIERARRGWRLVRLPTWLPRVDLPTVSSAEALPAAKRSMAIALSTHLGVNVEGQPVRTVAAMRDAMKARAAALPREPDGLSTAEAVILADADMPWPVVLWAMQTCADPAVKAYKIHFGVRHRASGELGVLSAELPKDRGHPGDRVGEAPPAPIKVRLFGRDSGRPAQPEAVYHELVRRRAAGEKAPVVEISAPPPHGSRVRYGFVMGILDAVRRAGYARVTFEGAPMPRGDPAGGAGQADLEDELRRLVRQPAGVPIVRIDGTEVVGTDPPPEPIPDGPGPVADVVGPEPDPFEDVVAPPAPPTPKPAPPPPKPAVPEGTAPSGVVPESPEETEQVHPEDVVAREPEIKDAEFMEGEVPDTEVGDDDLPFEGPADNGLLGLGGGAGGAFRGRGGARNLRAAGSGRATAAEQAVEKALRWLAAHQSPDGGWSAEGFGAWCDGKEASGTRPEGPGKALYDTGVTGLALCAFLGAGYTNRGSHEFAKVVSKGLRYLKNVQDAEGCFGPRTSQRYSYNHAIATLAMVEAYGMTESSIFKGPAAKGLDFVAIMRNPDSAWRYGVKPGDSDTSVTGWMMMALKSAALVNADSVKQGKPPPLAIDVEGFTGVRAWIDKVTDPDYGRVGYIQRGTGPARSTEMIDRFPTDKSESMTAVGILARVYLGEDPKQSDMIRKGVRLCLDLLPSWNTTDGSIDMYYWYYATLALHQVGGDAWKKWNEAAVPAFLAGQRTDTDPCAYQGSWDPVDPWGPDGGRVYSTALMALCLETPNRYERIAAAKDGGK
jgi:biopolymer transport protein ExbD